MAAKRIAVSVAQQAREHGPLREIVAPRLNPKRMNTSKNIIRAKCRQIDKDKAMWSKPPAKFFEICGQFVRVEMLDYVESDKQIAFDVRRRHGKNVPNPYVLA